MDPRGAGRPELARKPGEARIPKRKLAILLSYRGTQYHGLQRQTDPALKTIEGEMRVALSKAGAVSPENAEDLSKIGWSRSARTDKRAPAAQNIVAAKLKWKMMMWTPSYLGSTTSCRMTSASSMPFE